MHRPSLALVLLLLASPAARADEPVRVLVVGLQAKGAVLPADAEVISGIVTARLQRYPNVDVLSGADLREMIALEAEKQRMGCDDASCLSEVAGALGAELIVTGQLGRLGDRYVVTLNLIDVEKARAVARETMDLKSLSKAPAAVPKAVDKLMQPMGERVGRPDDEVSFVTTLQRGLTWTGWTLAGVGAGTLLVQYLGFIIPYTGLASTPLDTAYVPVCGPGAVALNEELSNPDPQHSEGLSNLGCVCCFGQLCSCALCLTAPAVLGMGPVVGLFASEDDDALAAAGLPAPLPSPLSDEERARLAANMAY